MRKLPEKLGSHAEYKCGFKSALQKCVYDSQTSGEFEKSWEVFLDTYNLHKNAWLQNLYSEQMYWVPIYLKDTFWTRMSTTQRSESMNSFSDGFVHLGITLKEFVDQFDNALRKKVENEMTTDFHSFNCTVPCISHLFLSFKLMTRGKLKTTSNDQLCKHTSMKMSARPCELFEMRGIICSYILAIFAARDVQVLSEKYIMDRWRKDIKHRYALIRCSYDDLSGKPAAGRYSSLIKICYEVATNAVESEDNSLDMTQKLQAINLIYTKSKSQAKVASTHTSMDAETGSSKKVLSPRILRGKGRSRSKRRQPTIKKFQTKNKKPSGKQERKIKIVERFK